MAQATVWQVPNLAQAVVDSTAGTLTYQTYDSSTSSWVTQWTLTLTTGAITVTQSQTVSGSITANGINPSNTVNSFAGTTTGTVYWVMPFQGSGYKKVLVYLDAYENDTATAQTITYPTAFTQTPNITNPGAVPGVSTTTTALSIDPDTTTAYTGWITVEGY
jgi:hypothetical protein